MHSKVFCIGFQKTGTSSIGAALRILGYRVHNGFRFNQPGKVKVEPPVSLAKLADIALPLVPKFSGFQDNPWCLLFRELDAAFPGSRFILTRRAPDKWADSLYRHFRETDSAMFRFIYGCDTAAARPRGHYLERYEAHNQAVLSYFKNRPSDLLILDLETANWDPLCAFLGHRKPLLRAYPHRNAAPVRERRRARKVRLGL